MRVVHETPSTLDKVQQSINKFGSKPEHNTNYYFHNKAKNSKNIVFDFSDDKLILSSYDEKLNIWSLFPSGILAPAEESVDLLLEFCRYCLEEKSGRKLIMEIDDKIFKGLKGRIRNMSLNFKILNVNLVRYWPIIDLKLWNQDLKGKRWRKLRKMKNKFFKNNEINIIPSAELPKTALKKVVFDWKENRKGRDRIDEFLYTNFIENDFSGIDYAMSICVGNVPYSISAGWKIPNTNSFYLSIMLHNYKIKGLGEAMYLESLNDLKNMRFDSVDLGGSDMDLLLFKQKFHPSHNYKTFEFSVKKN